MWICLKVDTVSPSNRFEINILQKTKALLTKLNGSISWYMGGIRLDYNHNSFAENF